MFFLTAAVQFWSKWGFRFAVVVSLASNLLVGLLSGRRRSSASGWWAVFQLPVALLLWLAYQFAEAAATSALGSLSLCGSDASADEQQLVAFWAPFLLLHLGGPDNMTAYTLEDNKLSLRKGVEMILQILGVIYAIYNTTYRGHSWVLLAASVIMLLVGGGRYVERAYALWRANLDNMQEQESSKKTDQPGSSESTSSTKRSVVSRISRSLGRELDDGEALLLAQDLFPITRRRALADSSVMPKSSNQRASEMIFSLGWEDMCKVVELELSLMYELLYTKAILAHTWAFYLIRFTSPLATVAAASLSWLWLHEHDGRGRIGASFVKITYLLLGATIALDVVWLLRTLGSTWTYAFLKARPQWACLYHQVLCAGRWHQFHRALVYLDPLRLFGCDAISYGHRYRRWSGTIGRYNLLRECATTTTTRRSCCLSIYHWLATKSGLEETRYLSELHQCVKKLLFERVRQILPMVHKSTTPAAEEPYTMPSIMTSWGEEALERNEELFHGGRPKCGKEFEEDVLMWHIATCIFLSHKTVKKVVAEPSSTLVATVEAIKTMSEYLMFLVVERRQMLPGLVLHSLLEATRRALVDKWNEGKGAATTTSHTSCTAAANKEDLLANILRRTRTSNPRWSEDEDGEGKRLVRDAVETAAALNKGSIRQQKVPPMLKFIFEMWVDKLLYAGVKCSRECHAQQLSRGGELTTLLWIIIHHAGPFRIGEKPEEKKKKKVKEAEEKKKKEEEKVELVDSWPPPFPPPAAAPTRPDPWGGWPVPKLPERVKEDEISMPDDADPLDAKENEMPINYVTL